MKNTIIKYFDEENNRLCYIGTKSNSEFWDNHWFVNNIEKIYNNRISQFDFVVRISKKYLSPKSKVLEGGCGVGQEVNKLKKNGFEVIGIDFAKKTVEIVNQAKPELDIRFGDVRKLDFTDNFFDGYWSFGVIEHFYFGYDDICQEMLRVIKSGAYLFLTFPHMSKLRKIKAKKNKYSKWVNDEKLTEQFYQFALDEKNVLEKFKNIGFKFVEKKHLNGLKGLKDEINFLTKFLQKIYDSKNIFFKITGKIIDIFFNNFSSHSILLVFQKQ